MATIAINTDEQEQVRNEKSFSKKEKRKAKIAACIGDRIKPDISKTQYKARQPKDYGIKRHNIS